MYKTELHCHSSEVSNCAHADSKYIVGKYVEAGYTSLVLTNHFSKYTFKNSRFDMLDSPWEDKVKYFIDGYDKMKEVAGDKLNILLGIEFRYLGGINDYQIYGMTREFLLDHPEMFTMNCKDLSKLVRNAGMLFIQAHPFRNGMKIIKPELLDGIEVYNGHTGHDSRNDIAFAWAEKYGLLKTSGSDFHDPEHHCSGGILTDKPITTTEDLLNILKSGNYSLIRDDIVPY